MKLWLDDIRKCPFVGNWKTAKNFDEAVKIMQEYDSLQSHPECTEVLMVQYCNPVEEIHFTPGTPFFIKARWLYEF